MRVPSWVAVAMTTIAPPNASMRAAASLPNSSRRGSSADVNAAIARTRSRPRDSRGTERSANAVLLDMATVKSVNVGQIAEVTWGGRSFTTAIRKHPVAGRIALVGVNLAGDDQADRSVHGGVDKAVYGYGMADYDWWAGEGGVAVEPAT